MSSKPKSNATQEPETGAKPIEQMASSPAVQTADAPASQAAAAMAEQAAEQNASSEPSEARKGPPGVTVVVTALQPSRWRIGRQFGREPTSIPAEELTEADALALQSDPLLTVSLVQTPY